MAEHAEEVGEWIAARRGEIGLKVKDLATLVGVSTKTVNNVESGRTSVQTSARGSWETALGWPAGSLEAAYRRGQHPRPEGKHRGRDARRELDEDERRALMDLGRRVAVEYMERGGEPERAAALLAIMAEQTGLTIEERDLLVTGARTRQEFDALADEDARLMEQRHHGLAADKQEDEPVGVRRRREQDEAAERGDG